jgi:hypothetical protein
MSAKRIIPVTTIACAGFLAVGIAGAAEPAKAAKPADKDRSARIDALAPFNALIAGWRCIGSPGGTDRNKDNWTESAAWIWKLAGEPQIRLKITGGRYWAEGVITYDFGKKHYVFSAVRPDKSTVVYTGDFNAGKDTLTVSSDSAGPDGLRERVVFRLLHENRYIIHVERAKGDGRFARVAELGCTKEGEPFGKLADYAKCVVSGGRGTSSVTYQGRQYLVCCSGCRDAFVSDPPKYIAEALQKGWLKP